MNCPNIIKFTVLMGLLFATPAAEAAPAQPKPNFILIFAGDRDIHPCEIKSRTVKTTP